MVIEKVHGLQATSLSLNERFTLLTHAAPDQVTVRQRQQQQRRRSAVLAQNLLEQAARQMEMQAKRALKQRLGVPHTGLRRSGSEGNLSRMRSNSFNNLSQHGVKSRLSWRQSNGNLSRSVSFSNLANAAWRGFRRRGGGQRQLRGRFRGRGRGVGRVNAQYRTQQRTNGARSFRPQVAKRGRGNPRGRGNARGRGISRNQQPKLMSKEELDQQLDQYMACTKSALDEQLDNYMKTAMELE